MSEDLREAVQMLAASNARMCDILIAADALAAQLERYIAACTTPSRERSPDYSLPKLKRELEAYRIVRSGQ